MFCRTLGSGFAAVPPAEKILPADTLAVVSIPDCSRLAQFLNNSPQSRFWHDNAMKPFRDKFLSKFQEEFIQPLERELEVHFRDYTPLLQGQLTLAITQNGWCGTEDPPLGFVLLLDTREKSGLLRTNLAAIRKKRQESDKPFKNEKFLNYNFTSLSLSTNDIPGTLRKLFPPPLELQEATTEAQVKPEPRRAEVCFGQVGALLIIGNSVSLVEKLVSRVSGGPAPTLSEVPVFEHLHGASLRDAPLYGWVRVGSFIDIIARRQSEKAEPEIPDPFTLVNTDKLLTGTGLGGLKALAFSLQRCEGGSLFQVFLDVPESGRQGILQVLTTQSKCSTPPPFVPTDVVRFRRWRIDGQKAWAALDKMLVEVAPQWSSAIDFLLDAASSAVARNEPGFNLKQSLFNNLGDDLIFYEKTPRTGASGDPGSSPSVLLIASPNAFGFAVALKNLFTFNQTTALPEREFLGRKVFSVPLPSLPLLSSEPAKSTGTKFLNFAASGGYVAFSSDAASLEEFLRSGENPGKALVETPGLMEAAQKVVASGNGCFGFENKVESMRAVFEGLKRDPNSVGRASQWVALIAAIGMASTGKDVVDWMDFALLPPFERVSNYFSFTVFGGTCSVEGLKYSFFTPLPPGGKAFP